MAKSNPAIIHFVALSIVLPLSARTVPASFGTQDPRPNVVVSMYFVGEKLVCPPDGYDGSGETSECPELTFEWLESMVSRGIAKPVQRNIPPAQIRLGKSLFDSVEAFSEDCTIEAPCADQPDRRYAIILAFEVSDARRSAGKRIEVERVPPRDSRFEEYSASGRLSERGRWLNHQRADVFLPSYDVRWVLQLGDWTWNFGTQQ